MLKNLDLAEAERMIESGMAGVEAARAKVAKLATEGYRAEELGRAVAFLAECEGALKAITLVQRGLAYADRTGETVDLKDELLDVLVVGADDSWSGRGNDLKRSEFDGYRAQARQLLRSL